MPKRPPFSQLKLRMPYSLRKALEQACEKSGKSLNAEIVWRLDRSLGHEGTTYAEHEAAELAHLQRFANMLELPLEARERLFKELVQDALGKGKKR